MDRQWLAGEELSPPADLRLFCLPYAGGRASIYHGWHAAAPRHVQVCALELPGRGRRLREAPYVRLGPLVRALATLLESIPERPFALFGHSMGGLVAFELARTLRERGGPEPTHLFVSASAAPSTPATGPLIHCAPDVEVKRTLRDLNGTPQELLDNEELMALILPTFRADLSVLENYHYRDEPPLDVPITVFGGTSDPFVPPSALAGWRRQSTSGSRLQLFPGDHFFVNTAASEVMGAIALDLG